MLKKKLWPFIVSIAAASFFCFVLWDAFSKSLSELVLWLTLLIAFVFLLTYLAKRSISWFILAIVGTLGLAFTINLIFVGHLLSTSLIQPSTSKIAQQYIDAVMANNVAQALALTDGSLECQDLMKVTIQSLEQELEKRHGAEWRDQDLGNVITNGFFLSEPTPHESFNVLVYKTNEDLLSTPYIVTGLSTTYTAYGKRYTCGRELILQ